MLFKRRMAKIALSAGKFWFALQQCPPNRNNPLVVRGPTPAAA